MKKLLSILIFVIFGVSTAYAAKAHAKAELTLYAQPSNIAGYVEVSKTSISNFANYTSWSTSSDYDKNEKSENVRVILGGGTKTVEASIYGYAAVQAGNGYTFMGWSSDGTRIDQTPNPNSSGVSSYSFKTSHTTNVAFGTTITGEETFEHRQIYAIFKPIIECTTQKIDITKTGETGTEKFNATLRYAKDFAIQVTDINGQPTNDLTCEVVKVGTEETSDVPTSGEYDVELEVQAQAGAEKGDVFKIILTATNGARHEVTVEIFENITVIFNAPTVGKGSYKYLRESDLEEKSITTKDTTIVMSKSDRYTLTATAASNYRFDRWIFAKGDPVYTNPYVYATKDGDEVTAEFVESKYAMFMIKGKDGVYYNDLNRAIEATGGAGVVLVYQSGFLAPDNYSIPSGVTLLIPGDDTYTVRTTETKEDDFDTPSTRVCKRYLTLSDNTTITVQNGGAISVYAKMSNTMPTNGMPYSFGRIDMGNNCHIVVESGAVLSALGYITGDPDESSVTIRSGATVYEAFQIRDWRGGTAVLDVAGTGMADVISNLYSGEDLYVNSSDKQVFPVGQYYLQTVETKLIIESGAQEMMTTAATMSLSSFGEVEMVVNAPFIVPDNNNYPSGFFRLNSGVKLMKYYDRSKDRQKYEIKGAGLNSTARFGQLSLTFPVKADIYGIQKGINVIVSSEGYVLPITNNLDVTLDNVTVSMTYDMNLLGDASVTINNNAALEVSQNARFFISDKEESKSMWYGSSNVKNATIMPLAYTPDSSQYLLDASRKLIPSTDATVIKDGNYFTTSKGNLYKRQVDDIAAYEHDIAMKDAKIEVNGKLIVNGRLYTTQSGADITSSGAGTVEFKQVDHATGDKLYRYMQIAEGDLAIGFHAIPVTNAKLHNDESKNSSEPYAAINAQAGETYTYVKSLGKWLLPQDLTITSHTGENFALTLPEDKVQNIVCNVQTENNTITKANFEVVYPEDGKFTKAGEPIYDATAKTLIIPVKYAHQNKHNVDVPHKEMLVVNCKNLTNNAVLHTEEIELKATEDYTPKFIVSINDVKYTDGSTYPLISGKFVDDVVPFNVVISAESSNVANALADWTNTCTAPFSFALGEKTDIPYATAQLIYNPISSGEHIGSLSITATYVDGTDLQLSSTVTINLSAEANLKTNPLAFAQFPQPININTPAFVLIDANTNLADSYIDVTPKTGIVTISGTGDATDPYMVKPNSIGVVTITASQEDSRAYYGKIISKTIAIVDPNIYPVPFCINEESGLAEFNRRLYGGNNVSYNTTNHTVDLNSTSSGSEWILRFNGTPDKLTFTPKGNNLWTVQQRSSENGEWEDLVTWSPLPSEVQVSYQLKPTTCQVRIQYGSANSEVGTIENLCITDLQISTNIDKLYLPIYADKTSEKTFVLTHTENAIPVIELASGLTYEAELSENLGTEGAPYYRTTIKVFATSITVEDEYVFTATENGNTVTVFIDAYKFPQDLPIKLAIDDVDRYHFVTTASSYVQWDAVNRQVVLQNPGAQLPRVLTFAFNGAPSIIRFEAYSAMGEEMIVDSVWTIEESENGEYFYPSNKQRDTLETNTLVQELNYTTRFVRIRYNSELLREIRLSNIVIEGYPDVIVEPQKMMLTASTQQQQLYAIAINLQEVDFVVDNVAAFQITTDTTFQTGWTDVIHATEATHSSALGINKVDTIFLGVKWNKCSALDEGGISLINKSNGRDSVLTIINLMGSDDYLVKEKANQTGIYTGIDSLSYTYHNAMYKEYQYHQVDLTNTFAEDGTALFDYLLIYGPTTPADGTDITAPRVGSVDGSTDIGSNAVTPYFVYRKALNADQQYKGYRFVGKVDNANVSDKAIVVDQVTNDTIITKDSTSVVYINVQDTALSIYMTGFCPYATTGYDKLQEGVFLFRGTHGAKLDLYLEDFHVFSRNKTRNGNAFYGKDGAEHFSDGYARGSGGVLVFENVDPQEQLQNYQPYEVSIHTMGNNLLKSNYGCFFGLNILGQVAMKATQVSSPIQVHMHNRGYERKTKTNLNFDDIWPTAVDANGVVSETKRTNGYLGLKKQANNAPSIDIGNKHTEVNFNGGQIELQNSQIGSDTYKTTLAISHRSGYFGADEVGIQLCYGIGTDSVGGTVNILDGTILVERMKVDSAYSQYYLMDTLPNGEKSEYTSCLRTPKNTYVRGGSTCPIRACQHVTSKGGAPKEREKGKYLGRYVYKMHEGDIIDQETKLAKINVFPSNVDGLSMHYQTSAYTYGLNSVTPDADSLLYFWLPEGFVAVEKDAFMATWKACMTEISAGVTGVAEGSIGGDTPIEYGEEVKYFLYCKLDKNIHDVISAGYMENDKKKYTYKAPLKVPSAASKFFGDATYARWAPNKVGGAYEHQVLSDTSYTITDKVYYITTATADIWQTFTAPFDVAKIHVVETYSEDVLQQITAPDQTTTARKTILREQAAHNADFASFFAVAMAMGSKDSFDEIYQSYIEWSKIQDRDSTGIWNGEGDYTLRGMQELTPYYGNNWREANFYLNHNTGNWPLIGEEDFESKWQLLPDTATADGILMHKGETYSLLFPYCVGCETSLEDREYWDYWSGKFIIFESASAPQTIRGRDFLNDTIAGNVFSTIVPEDHAVVTGNSTFAFLNTQNPNVYIYENNYPATNSEYFGLNVDNDTIVPTSTFLYTGVTNQNGMPARSITRMGEVIYDDDNNGTGGHIPTVGGGNDLFITTIEEGINVAVATPQHVRVLSSTGAVIYSGMIQTALDIPLPCVGVYVVSGENEVQKVLY